MARQRRAHAFQFNYFFAPFSIHCAITSINFGFRGSVASKQKHTPGRSEDTRVWYQETVFSGSGRKNVMSMRELCCPDPLAGLNKRRDFKYFIA